MAPKTLGAVLFLPEELELCSICYDLSIVKTIIFDFDGTLADSFATLVGVFEEVTARTQKLTTVEIEDLRGKSLRDIIKYLKVRKWQIPKLLLKAKRIIATRMPGIHPFKDIPAVLKKLHGDGYQMFILSTNSSSNISKFLKVNDMDQYFEKIYGDIGLRSKASALKRVIKKEGLDISQSVYVGDEVRDIEASKKVGIKIISVGWGFNHPDVLQRAKPSALAGQPTDLSAILKKI